VLCLCPVAGLLGWLGDSQERPASRTAATFLDDIERGNDPAAYALLCSWVRQEYDVGRFTKAVGALPRPRSHRMGRVAFLDEAETSAAVHADLTDAAGHRQTQEFQLRRIHQTWTVCGDPW